MTRKTYSAPPLEKAIEVEVRPGRVQRFPAGWTGKLPKAPEQAEPAEAEPAETDEE